MNRFFTPWHKDQARLPALLFAALTLLLLPVLLGACSDEGQAADSAAVALVDDIKGNVEWSGPDAATWEAVANGQQLAPGTAVRTAAASHVWLTFPGDSRAYLAPNTDVEITTIEVPDGTAAPTIRLHQRRGETRHIVVDPGEDATTTYEVTTPDGAATSDSGAFVVFVDKSDVGGDSRVTVGDGRVTTSAAGATYPVTAGQTIALHDEQVPTMANFAVYGQGDVTQTGDIWVIGGRAFIVDDNTHLRGAFTTGDTVFVSGHVRSDGDLVADLIVPAADGGVLFTGVDDEITFAAEDACVATTGTVTARDGDIITLHDGTVVDLGDAAAVEGDVTLYDTVLIVTCSNGDGDSTFRLFVLRDADDDFQNGGQVSLCHLPPGNPDNAHTITVDEAAVGAHLAHGDYVGACEAVNDAPGDTGPVTICHVNPDDPTDVTTITVDESELDAHLAHGDEIGACSVPQDDDLDDEGATTAQVTVCHIPPGNPGNAHTITVGEPAVPAHLGHGDYTGACNQ